MCNHGVQPILNGCNVFCSPGCSEVGSSLSSPSRTSFLGPLRLWRWPISSLSPNVSSSNRVDSMKFGHLEGIWRCKWASSHMKAYFHRWRQCPQCFDNQDGKVKLDIVLEAIQNDTRELFQLILVSPFRGILCPTNRWARLRSLDTKEDDVALIIVIATGLKIDR